MAEISTIARPYAQAAFDVAKSENALPAWDVFLSAAANVAALDDVRQLANNPSVTSDQLSSVLEAAIKPTSAGMGNFLKAIVASSRVEALPAVYVAFAAQRHAFEGSADAHIVSAFPLDAAQASDLTASLESKLGKKLNPNFNVDGSLIGGFCVTVGDEVLDMSVRAKLMNMQTALKA